MLIFQLAVLVFGRRFYPLQNPPLHLCKGAPNRKARLQEHGAVGRHKASVRVADHHDLTTKESTHHNFWEGRDHQSWSQHPTIAAIAPSLVQCHVDSKSWLKGLLEIEIWPWWIELEQKSGYHEGLKTGYPFDHRKMNLNSLWTHCFHQGLVNYAPSYRAIGAGIRNHPMILWKILLFATS